MNSLAEPRHSNAMRLHFNANNTITEIERKKRERERREQLMLRFKDELVQAVENAIRLFRLSHLQSTVKQQQQHQN